VGAGFVIDLHSHILPGVDDGARTLEDAIEIGDEALARWLSVEVPGAIIAGRPLPDRPAKRRLSWLRRG
jgi:hypothetical protein